MKSLIEQAICNNALLVSKVLYQQFLGLETKIKCQMVAQRSSDRVHEIYAFSYPYANLFFNKSFWKRTGKTPLEIAKENNYQEMFDILKEAKKNYTEKSKLKSIMDSVKLLNLKKRYEQKTDKSIHIKMHYGVENTPLSDFDITLEITQSVK